MRGLRSWVAGAGVGLARAAAVVAVALVVPAVWAAALALGIAWGASNPWSWLAPAVLVGPARSGSPVRSAGRSASS